nr:hypothetical protein Iba_chr09cCG1810 [Ipomoea batatas]
MMNYKTNMHPPWLYPRLLSIPNTRTRVCNHQLDPSITAKHQVLRVCLWHPPSGRLLHLRGYQQSIT